MENDGKVIALLIDAENVSPKYIKTIIDEVSMYGTPAYKRIYGDWTAPDMVSWKKMLLEHNLTPIQQFSYTQGKNASDSAMIIDAMDILYTKNVDGFCIVSSDSDFTRLAARLRESRMFVIGMGESKTPNSFIAACNKFKYLDILAAADEEEFMLAVAEAGGDDYEDADEEWIVYTAPGDLMAVVKELEAQGIQVKGAEMTMIANTPSAVSVADAKKVMRLIDKLEELEDLQAVYHTMDITDEIAEALDE